MCVLESPHPHLKRRVGNELLQQKVGVMVVSGCSPVTNHSMCWKRSADCRQVCSLNPVPRSRNFSFQNKTKGSQHMQLKLIDLHKGFCDAS